MSLTHVIAQCNCPSSHPNFKLSQGFEAALFDIPSFVPLSSHRNRAYLPFVRQTQTTVTMATPSAQVVALVVNNVANAPEEHVKQIIEALKALPQMQTGTNMSASNGVTKSRKKVSPKQDVKGPKRPLNSWMAFRSKSSTLNSPLNTANNSKNSTTRCLAHVPRRSSRRS